MLEAWVPKIANCCTGSLRSRRAFLVVEAMLSGAEPNENEVSVASQSFYSMCKDASQVPGGSGRSRARFRTPIQVL